MVYSIIFNVRTWFNVRPCRFDIYSFGLNAKEDKDGMMESKHLISQLVEDEIRVGTPPHRILLGGFSQGGAMSLLVGLTGERKLAGLAILSSWLPLRSDFEQVRSCSCPPLLTVPERI